MRTSSNPRGSLLLDAATARKLHEEIVRSLKDPALLEHAGQDLFKVRISRSSPARRSGSN